MHDVQTEVYDDTECDAQRGWWAGYLMPDGTFDAVSGPYDTHADAEDYWHTGN